MKKEPGGGNARILAYTRQPADTYPRGLACSVHFAISRDGRSYDALHGNYGILFAQGTVGPDDTIQAKGLQHPFLFPMPCGGFGIAAVRINEDGTADAESRGKVLLFTTPDFIRFRELGLLSLHADTDVQRVQCRYDGTERRYHIAWTDTGGNRHFNTTEDIRSLTSRPENRSHCDMEQAPHLMAPKGAVAGNTVEIDGNLCDRTALHWNPLTCTGVHVPARIYAASAADLEAVQATAVYSDGSTAQKPVLWDTAAVDFSKPGVCRIRGTVQNETYAFPLARGYGDPVVFSWQGQYYFISTNDNTQDIGLYVREAGDPAGLFRETAPQHRILDRDASRGLVQTFWAPEFHVIGGAPYLLFAVSGEQWGPQCHVMKLKEGGRITDPAGWEDPVRVRREDGSPLAQDGITLDMTYLSVPGGAYMIWSYRRHIGTALDTGSMLYIAAVDPAAPWRLTGEPVLLSRPLYGWENVGQTINNEAPAAFVAGERIYLTYSGGSANSFTYAVGLLTAESGTDLLDPSVWRKRITPVVSYYSVEGEYGPGHNSFFTDERGNRMIAYHAEESIGGNLRCVGIRRVHFDIHREPVFDLSPKEDWNAGFSAVETQAIIIPG